MLRFNIPSTNKQLFFIGVLNEARSNMLHEAITAACIKIKPDTLRLEMVEYVPPVGLKALQGSGIRDEEVYVIPSVLKEMPQALGYYRLLLGISQKQFYSSKTGLAKFQKMENGSKLVNVELFPDLCRAINETMTNFLCQIPPVALRYDVNHLPIMALGVQADGSWRNKKGGEAAKIVFNAFKTIINETNARYQQHGNTSIDVTNNSGRRVDIIFGKDPDVKITEHFEHEVEYKAAIEIKGGDDTSNIHNRAGEAEKSHQKAKNDGAKSCWTVIRYESGLIESLKADSPATSEWIDLNSIDNRSGRDWEKMERLIKSAVGI